ncbi:MAG: M48 family metallopeptidase [Planctomycetota bacterium]
MQDLSVSYRRSTRAKRMRITVHPTQEVTVTVPRGFSLKRAEAFVQSKQAWIRKHLIKNQQIEDIREKQPELSPQELERVQNDLFSRLERFSDQYDLPYRRAAFRCQKTKWGSCSNQNNISLNINIAFLPEHLQDYILLHELCHIRHMNHSKAFWAQLDEYCGGKAKEYAKELKTHPMKIGA